MLQNVIPLASQDAVLGVAGTASAIAYSIFGREVRQDGSQVFAGILAQGQLPTTAAQLYAPAGFNGAEISQIVLTNTSASAVASISLYLRDTNAKNTVLSAIVIPAHGAAFVSPAGVTISDQNGNLYTTGASFDSVAPTDVTPLAVSTSGTASIAARRDHVHQTPGGIASRVTATSAIVNAEAQILGATIPANFLRAGTTFRIRVAGNGTTSTSPGNTTFKVRLGPTTLTGNILASLACAANASKTGQPFELDILVTIRTITASGTAIASIRVISNDASAGLFNALIFQTVATSTQAVDATVANILEVTATTGAATSSVTVEIAEIEVVKM